MAMLLGMTSRNDIPLNTGYDSVVLFLWQEDKKEGWVKTLSSDSPLAVLHCIGCASEEANNSRVHVRGKVNLP